MKVYVSGAWTYRWGPEFQDIVAWVEQQGYQITRRWWEDAQVTAETAMADLRGVHDADILVAVLTVPDYRYQGVWVEIGAALATGKPVYVIGEAGNACLFVHHPLVKRGLPVLR